MLSTEVVVLRAVRGHDARLPCGQGKVFLDGPDAYVLWLKNEREFLYRFPNEETQRRSLSLDQVFGTTCIAGACHDDTSLLLKRVSDRDSGVYRCRVHYQASPSVDYVIDIRLVDSPGTPQIYNDAGEPLQRGHIQHISLGTNFTLTCEVADEQPDTLLFWRRNGIVIERAEASRPRTLRATVSVTNATRAELDAHYECLAQNADVTEPLSASVLVTMYLPPLSVEIRLNNNVDFEAGQPRVVDCVVVGCVPPPSITWHLGDTLLRPSVHKELHDGNYTVSSLTLAPSLRDGGRELACRAHNSHLPGLVFQDEVTLNVGYRPVCLSSGEETIGAVPGEAETVTCVVEAAPEPLQFSWTFADSRTLYTSVKKLSGHHHRYSSTLTWLPRAGDYGALLCRATNSFGEQKRACAYVVARGGAPRAPRCLVREVGTLRIQCKKDWDGGRPQTVHLVVRDATGTVVTNASDAAGHFQLALAGRNLSAVVYASNSRGRSEEVELQMQNTPTSAFAVIEPTPVRGWARWLEVSAIVVVATVAIAATTLCVRAVRARRHTDNPDLVPRADGTFHREPDFVSGERVLGTTNITVNQLASCQNQYSSSPVPSCRVLVGCPHPPPDTCPAPQHSYYV
ncbi:hemicentin-2-like [Cydia splendana]|uniref:hemicentin-2-like n=1 Tax=Cydia splendana TaxID=1100963 RepID=UPI00300D9C95